MLDQIYKLYIRPHLDYGDSIYHKHDPHDVTKRLEQTKYSAALAITGAWRRISRQRLYDQLGWKDLHHRRWLRLLCHFLTCVKIVNRRICLMKFLLLLKFRISLRNVNEYDAAVCRTAHISKMCSLKGMCEQKMFVSRIR